MIRLLDNGEFIKGLKADEIANGFSTVRSNYNSFPFIPALSLGERVKLCRDFIDRLS